MHAARDEIHSMLEELALASIVRIIGYHIISIITP